MNDQRKTESVKGYIHNVSSLKRGAKRPYFEAQIQEKLKIQRVVVFKPELHSEFQMVNLQRTPVHLQNIVVQLSRVDQTQEVLFGFKSRMMCIKGLDYSYNTTLKVTESDKVVPICDVLKIENEFQRVNVKVQIIHIESQGYNFIQDQRFFPNTTYRVADNTGQIDFTNWGEKTLNIGSWYILSSVSVRHFKGNLIITSTRDSTLLEEDPDPDMILTTQHTTTSTNVTTEIIGATINVHHICPQHHKITNMPMSVSRVHCPKCNTHYKVTSITMYSYGNLTFKTSSEIQTATIENQLINSIIDLPPHPSADTIIDLLLELPPVNITIHNGRITRISQASATQASATQASATQASATQASATQASATQASATQASATQASATQASATLFPTDLELDQFMTDDFFDESASTLPPTIPPTKAPNPTKRKPPQLKKD